MQPVVLKLSLPIALLTLLRFLAPAVVAIAALYVMAQLFGVPFSDDYMMLAVLVGILAPFILHMPPAASALTRRRSLAHRIGRVTMIPGLFSSIGS